MTKMQKVARTLNDECSACGAVMVRGETMCLRCQRGKPLAKNETLEREFRHLLNTLLWKDADGKGYAKLIRMFGDALRTASAVRYRDALTEAERESLDGAADFLEHHIPEGYKCCEDCGNVAFKRAGAVRRAIDLLEQRAGQP